MTAVVHAETTASDTPPKRLSKRSLRTAWWLWYTGTLTSMSFEWLQSFGFAHSMSPVIKELYADDPAEQIAALKRHSSFYNTEPQLGAVVNGIACGMEEERANGAAIDDEVINSVKVGLMGPLAGIGDAMIPGMYIPLLLSIGIGLAQGGNPLGPVFYLVTFLGSITALSYFVFMKGYQLGTRSVEMIIGDAAQRAREAFNLLGSIVVGGVAAGYVTLVTKLTIPLGDSPVVISDVLDGIFPKLLALVLVLIGWWLMSKKRISAIILMLIMVAIALVGVLLGVF